MSKFLKRKMADGDIYDTKRKMVDGDIHNRELNTPPLPTQADHGYAGRPRSQLTVTKFPLSDGRNMTLVKQDHINTD